MSDVDHPTAGAEGLSTEIVSRLDRIIQIGEELLMALTTDPQRKRTQVTDQLVSQAIVLMTRPENRIAKSGRVNHSAIARQLGIDRRTFAAIPEVQQALKAIEGY